MSNSVNCPDVQGSPSFSAESLKSKLEFKAKILFVRDLSDTVIKGFAELPTEKAHMYLNSLESALMDFLGDICSERQAME